MTSAKDCPSPSLLVPQDFRKVFAALVLVKSKPPGSSIQDYLQQIRQHLQYDQPPVCQHRRRYIDGVAFWKAAHTNSEAAKILLQEKIHQLEDEVRDLKDKWRSPQTGPHIANSQRKRKREESPQQARGARGPVQKRFRTDYATTCVQQWEEDSRIVLGELEGHLPGDQANNYLRRLHELQSILTQRALNFNQLAVAQINLSSALVDLLSEIGLIGQARSTTTQARKSTQREARIPVQDHVEANLALLLIIKRTFLHLLDSTRRIDSSPDAENSRAQVIYHVSHIFGSILETIQRLSSELAKEHLEQVYRLPRGYRRIFKPSTSTAQSPNDAANSRLELSCLFVQMLAALKPEENLQKDIVNAAFYHLLHRTGNLLNAFVFAADTATPDNSELKKNAQETLARQMDAPYLVWILERAMTLLQGQASATETSHSSVGMNQSTRDSQSICRVKTRLPHQLRVRLQNTMLKTVFAYDDKSFEDRFKEPVNPGLDLKTEVTCLDQGNIAKWFKEEVWRIVGWGILRNYVG